MKAIKAMAIFAVFALVITCAAGTVSAGVEPSPFKGKTIENRIQVARYQMVIMGSTLERFERKLNELPYRGTLVAAENQINLLNNEAINTLRTLQGARDLFEQRGDDDYDIAEDLEDFSEYNEALRDEVLGLEQHPLLSKAAKMALRQVAGILLDIEDLIDSFFTGNVD